jgi:hypothetical protein
MNDDHQARAMKASTATRKPPRNRTTGEETMTTNTPTAAELSRQAVAQAEANAAEWQRLNEQAEAAAAELLSRLARGDSTVTSAEWMTAKAEQEIAAELAKAGPILVKRAKAALINDDVRLADAFIDVVSELFSSQVPVKVVTERKHVVPPKDANKPVIYLLQEQAEKDKGGIYSGDLALTYFRGQLLAPLDCDRLWRACEQRGFIVDIQDRGSMHSGNAHQDSAVIRVSKAFAQVPVLAVAPDEASIRRFGQGVVGKLSNAVHYKGERRSVHYLGDGHKVDSSAELFHCRIVGTENGEGDGERMTAELWFTVKPSKELEEANVNAHAAMCGVVERYTNTADHGVGRAVTADALVTYTSGGRYKVASTFTFVYRIG